MGGLALAFIANIINFFTGNRNWKRVAGMVFAIAAVISIGVAGRLANLKVAEVANTADAAAKQAAGLAAFVNNQQHGGGL